MLFLNPGQGQARHLSPARRHLGGTHRMCATPLEQSKLIYRNLFRPLMPLGLAIEANNSELSFTQGATQCCRIVEKGQEEIMFGVCLVCRVPARMDRHRTASPTWSRPRRTKSESFYSEKERNFLSLCLSVRAVCAPLLSTKR